jgi:hypothetical protein
MWSRPTTLRSRPTDFLDTSFAPDRLERRERRAVACFALVVPQENASLTLVTRSRMRGNGVAQHGNWITADDRFR